MNDKKIAFIICANNDLFYDECVWYINRLNVPEGYETDIICIAGAESMTAAYNAAMESSDARYKVYLHQDVFIYHQDFIGDILKVFQADKQIGLLGVIGGVNLPQNAVIWNAWNRGSTLACNNKNAFPLIYIQDTPYAEAEAIDGMLMATQYDVPWREDLELGWDFYDVSQSLEFRRKGYKVVIPFQNTPWCMHDCGYSKLTHYDEARKKVLTEYRDFFRTAFQPVYDAEQQMLEEQIFLQLKNSIEKGLWEQALSIKQMIGERNIKSNNLQYALNMTEIYEEEHARSAGQKSFFAGLHVWEEIKNRYDIVKFITRYMENDGNPKAVEELLAMISDGEMTKEAVWSVARHSITDWEKVCRKIYGHNAADVLIETRKKEFYDMSRQLCVFLEKTVKLPDIDGMAVIYDNMRVLKGYLDYASRMAPYYKDRYTLEFVNNATALCNAGTVREAFEKNKEAYVKLAAELFVMAERISK